MIKTALSRTMSNVEVFWSNDDQSYKAMGVDKATNKTVLYNSNLNYDRRREIIDLQLNSNTTMKFRKITAN